MVESPTVTAEFLDTEQYTRAAIEAYESVYGRDFVSPGGAAVARELIGRLELEAGATVLDVGCGLGGSAFLMAREFGLRVDGIDLSRNMLAMASRRCDAYGLRDRVVLEHGDCLALSRPARYHAVYSRDVFLHIRDKPKLFRRLYDSLRPGGRLLFTDYCCGDRPWQAEFSTYVEDRAYILHTLADYVSLVEGAGFSDVSGQDWSARFSKILEKELARIRSSNIDAEKRVGLESGWRAKLARVASGDQRWAMIGAVKPAGVST